MFTDVTGIILAGGKSSRMGTNKALLEIGGRPIIQLVAELISGLFEKVALVTNSPEDYTFLKLPSFADIYRDLGPLAGIHAGLMHVQTERNFFISCDIPLMTHQLVEYITDYTTDKPIVLCNGDGYLQSLAGIYSKSLIPSIEEALKNAQKNIEINPGRKLKCSLHAYLENAAKEVIETDKLPFYKPGTFFNMNKTDDYSYIKNILEAGI